MNNEKRQSTDAKPKRLEFKDMQRRRQRRRRAVLLALLAVAMIAIAVVIAYPWIKSAFAPADDFVKITPLARPLAKGKSAGNPNAPVRVDVWEDFQCPACKQYSQLTEPQIMEEYVATGAVYYTYHNYPFIDDHATTKESDLAANAGMCAAEQGRFWDYHDLLFANWQGENLGVITDQRLIAFARSLGLNTDDFEKCFRTNRYQDQIDKEMAVGRNLGVVSTPSILVNGKIVVSSLGEGYVPSFSDIKNAIDQALGAGEY